MDDLYTMEMAYKFSGKIQGFSGNLLKGFKFFICIEISHLNLIVE